MRSLLTTLAELAGACLITIGAFKFSEPLGFVAAGLFTIAGSVLLASGGDA